jgi:hypothetical protein
MSRGRVSYRTQESRRFRPPTCPISTAWRPSTNPTLCSYPLPISIGWSPRGMIIIVVSPSRHPSSPVPRIFRACSWSARMIQQRVSRTWKARNTAISTSPAHRATFHRRSCSNNTGGSWTSSWRLFRPRHGRGRSMQSSPRRCAQRWCRRMCGGPIRRTHRIPR